MKTYKIIYTESITHEFYVDAENENAAREEFDRKVYNGEFDFSYGTVYDTNIDSVEEVT